MLASRAGRNATRLLPVQCNVAHRVDTLPTTLLRVSAAYSTTTPLELPIRTSPVVNASYSLNRTFATKPGPKPKAHTGRTTAPRQRKTPTTSGETPTKKTKEIKTRKSGQLKAKKAVKKPAKSARRAKKPQTEEQKAAAEEQKKKDQIRELKKLALRKPKLLPSTPYTIITSELSKEAHTIAGTEATAKYKNLVPEELEVCRFDSTLMYGYL